MKTAFSNISTTKRLSLSLSKPTWTYCCNRIANKRFQTCSSAPSAVFRAAALTTCALFLTPSSRALLDATDHYTQSRRFDSFFMSTHITERDGTGTIIVAPKNEANQSGLVVICHGLGDTAEGGTNKK
jgi:hypothetical protein